MRLFDSSWFEEIKMSKFDISVFAVVFIVWTLVVVFTIAIIFIGCANKHIGTTQCSAEFSYNCNCDCKDEVSLKEETKGLF